MSNESFNHPFCDYNCIRRLEKELNTHGSLVIGFDFDNTIFDVHNNGGNYKDIIDALKDCKDRGWTLCLYTSELDENWLKWKIDYCKHFGIAPDYVNESPLLKGTKKPFFSLLLDDRAGLQSAYLILKSILNYADSKPNQQGKG
jgi:hypothetical protein|nr:MAG TPA: nucleotidase 5'-nucleotidase [Caudoviricetes sp.]